MILEEIELENWKGYREKHAFKFNDGFNLLIGPNEAGKSTLFEALMKAFFARHSSNAEDIKVLQPLDSYLCPRVNLIFRTKSGRFRLEKQFLSGKSSQLFSFKNNQWRREAEGDASDQTIRKLLIGERGTKQAGNDKTGITHALWYFQKDIPNPKDGWDEDIFNRLEQKDSIISPSDDQNRIIELIAKKYKEYWTPSGQTAKNSPIRSIESEMPQIEKEIQDLQLNMQELSRLRNILEMAELQKIEKEDALKKTNFELSELSKILEKSEEYERTLFDRERKVKEQERVVKVFEEAQRKIIENEKLIKQLTGEIKILNSSLETNKSDERVERGLTDRYRLIWQNCDQKIIESDKKRDSLNSILKIRNINLQITEISEKLKELEKKSNQITLKKEELSLRLFPKDGDLDKFNLLQNNLISAKSKAEALGTQIRFELKEKVKITSTPDVEYRNETDEWLVISPTTFSLGNLGSIHVRGALSLQEIEQEIGQIQEKISSIFTHFSVQSKEELYHLVELRKNLELELKTFESERKGLLKKNSEEDLKTKIVELNREKMRIEKILEGFDSCWNAISDTKISENIFQIENEINKLRDEREESLKNENSSRIKTEKLNKDILEQEKILQGNIAQLTIHNDNKNACIREYGTIENLANQYNTTIETFKQCIDDYDLVKSQYNEVVAEPKIEQKRLLNQKELLTTQINEIKSQNQYNQSRIDAFHETGIYSKIDDNEGHLEYLKRKLERLKTESEAILLIHNLIQDTESQKTRHLSQPIGEQISNWFCELTAGEYEKVILNDELFPIELKKTYFKSSLPLSQISYGTYEQIWVLTRLAIALKISEEEPNLVVIDDRLVNADPVRLRRFCKILEDVLAQKCQIVVATCNDTPYASLDPHIIQVPESGLGK